jgi:hypothetical protein
VSESCGYRTRLAVAEGNNRVKVQDYDFGYGLFGDGIKVAGFAEGRIGCREWARRNGRLGDIHSLENRSDHNSDELIA